MSIDAVTPTGSVPMLQVTTPDSFVQGYDPGLAETKVTPAGNESVRTTPVASWGPAFETIRV